MFYINTVMLPPAVPNRIQHLFRGDGLGKNKDGNVKHISVTKKNDKKGVGVGQDQWEFAWWDHLFNKSASGVVINKDEEKGEVKRAHVFSLCQPRSLLTIATRSKWKRKITTCESRKPVLSVQ